jgi:hypothetical protein
MARANRLRRYLLLTIAVTVVAWTFGAPVAAEVLYPTPAQQPHGAGKVLFYCHLG